MGEIPVFLTVAQAIAIRNRGTAVLFREEPKSFLAWKYHRVEVARPDGSTIEAVAHAEYARQVPPGEVQALLFPGLAPAEIPPGSQVVVLDVVA